MAKKVLLVLLALLVPGGLIALFVAVAFHLRHRREPGALMASYFPATMSSASPDA